MARGVIGKALKGAAEVAVPWLREEALNNQRAQIQAERDAALNEMETARLAEQRAYDEKKAVAAAKAEQQKADLQFSRDISLQALEHGYRVQEEKEKQEAITTRELTTGAQKQAASFKESTTIAKLKNSGAIAVARVKGEEDRLTQEELYTYKAALQDDQQAHQTTLENLRIEDNVAARVFDAMEKRAENQKDRDLKVKLQSDEALTQKELKQLDAMNTESRIRLQSILDTQQMYQRFNKMSELATEADQRKFAQEEKMSTLDKDFAREMARDKYDDTVALKMLDYKNNIVLRGLDVEDQKAAREHQAQLRKDYLDYTQKYELQPTASAEMKLVMASVYSELEAVKQGALSAKDMKPLSEHVDIAKSLLEQMDVAPRTGEQMGVAPRTGEQPAVQESPELQNTRRSLAPLAAKAGFDVNNDVELENLRNQMLADPNKPSSQKWLPALNAWYESYGSNK